MLKLLFRLAYTAVMFIEALMITRIVLDFMDASLDNTFSSWAYYLSDIFMTPFTGLVSSSMQIDRFTVSLTPFVALLFYIIAAFILSELIKAFTRD